MNQNTKTAGVLVASLWLVTLKCFIMKSGWTT